MDAPVARVPSYAEVAFTAQLLDWQGCLGLLDEADDLLFGVSAFSMAAMFLG